MNIKPTITNQVYCPVMVIDHQLVITLSRLETGLYHHGLVTFQLEKLEPRHKTGVTKPNMDLANQHWLIPKVLVTNSAHQKMITLCVTCQVNHSTRNLTFWRKPNKGSWGDPSPILLLSRCQWHQGGGWWGPDDGWSETHQSWFWDADTDPPTPNCKQFTSKRLIILNTQQFMLLLNNHSSIQLRN